MQSRELARLFIRRFWLLIAGAVLAMAGGYLVFHFLTPWPTYQATTTVMISSSTPSADLESLQASSELAQTYAEWAMLRPVLQSVIDTLGLPVIFEELEQQVDVGAVLRTQLMTISATSSDPQQAADIANEIVRQLATEIATAFASAPPSGDADELASTSAEKIVQLEATISVAEAELMQLSETLADYQPASPSASDIASFEASISAAEAELVELNDALSGYEAASPPASEIAWLEATVEQNEARLNSLTSQLMETDSTTEADLLTKRVNAVQTNLTTYRGEIDRLYARTRSEWDAEVSQLARRISVLQFNVGMWQGETDRLYAVTQSDSEAEVHQLVRRINVVQANLGIWQRKLGDLKSDFSGDLGNDLKTDLETESVGRRIPHLVTVEEARAPEEPVSPVMNILVAGVAGLVCMIGLVLLIEFPREEPPAHRGESLGRGSEKLSASLVDEVASDRSEDSASTDLVHSEEGGKHS